MKSVGNCVKKLWDEVCRRVKNAAVFMDDGSAECLHWNGGLARLVNAGALDVKELSPFERTDAQKIVFIVSTPLYDTTADNIRDIIQASPCQYVVAITTVNLLAHVFLKTNSYEGEASDVVEQFEEKLLEWMGNMNYTAEVLHIPVTATEICPNFFILPSFNQLSPLMDCDLNQLELMSNSLKSDKNKWSNLSDVTMNMLPSNIRSFYKCFACCLHDLFDEMDVKEEIYSLGQTSRLIGQELENFPPAKSRRKTSQQSISLLLIDRALDLCTPTSESCDTLLDKLLHTLPRLPGHNNDIMIDMSCLSQAHNIGGETIAPGCLADIHNPNTLQSLVIGKQKETVMNLNRELIDAASREKLPVKLSSKTAAAGHDQLSTTAALFKQSSKAIDNHIGILQAALAVSQTLNHPSNRVHSNRMTQEKLLLQSIDDERRSLLSMVVELFDGEMKKPKDQRSYTLDDILTLLIHVYSMLGDSITYEHNTETILQEKIADAILKEPDDLSSLFSEIIGTRINHAVVTTKLDDIWVTLHSVARARRNLRQFTSLLEPATSVSPTALSPLIKQCLNAILDPSKPELVDLEYHSSALKDFLKSGFGLFKSVSKPRPDNNPVVLVFIVGGVTGSEVKVIRDALSAHKSSLQVVVGSTQIIKSTDVTKSLFSHDRLNLQTC